MRAATGTGAGVTGCSIALVAGLLMAAGPGLCRAAGGTECAVAPWPAGPGVLRVVIDTDAANEIDDQYALTLLLGRPDRFDVVGFVAAHFGDAGGHKGIEKSAAEIEAILGKVGMSGRYPIKHGSHPIRYKDQLERSEGVDFIIEQAMASSAEDPLWLILLGPATDAVAALEQEPAIADRLVVFWHGRTQFWPEKCWNFNVFNDLKATQMLFDSRCRFVLFDTGEQVRLGEMEVTEERFAGLGTMGRYLHELRLRDSRWQQPSKGVYDLADIATLVEPEIADWEKVRAPGVKTDYMYDFRVDNGEIIRIYDVDAGRSFELLEDALVRLERGAGREELAAD